MQKAIEKGRKFSSSVWKATRITGLLLWRKKTRKKAEVQSSISLLWEISKFSGRK